MPITMTSTPKSSETMDTLVAQLAGVVGAAQVITAPADLAAVILFLASPESRAMTGALVPVTGRV